MENIDVNKNMLIQKIQYMYEKYNRLAVKTGGTPKKIPVCRDITSINLDVLEKQYKEILDMYFSYYKYVLNKSNNEEEEET